MQYARITAMGHYAPALKVSNDDLSKFMDTSHEWIHSRTGIVNRHIAVDMGARELAVNAATAALESSHLSGEEIELIIVATFTSEYATPSLACLVQAAIGANRAMCFDVGAACSGFVYGLDVADQFIRTGKYKNALVIGAEKLSQILDWKDRGTAVLFGDGAGACVLEASNEPGILDSLNYAIGEDYACLYAKNKVNETPYYKGSDEHHLYMDGQDVFQFACRKVPLVLTELAEKLEISPDDVDLFVLHQANKRIIGKIAKTMKQPIDKFYMNMDEYGNTSAASIPIALSELSAEGKLRGKRVMIAGFGAGLTYGASMIQF